MRSIERQTLEKEHDRLKKAIETEKLAIAAGELSLDESSVGHPDPPVSRREQLLELQSRLGAVESRLASEELSVYDNTKIAVAKILGGEDRQRTRSFSELQSYYLFADKFGRPAKGNDKGKVEGLVGYARRNFMVPIPRASSWEELNLHLEADCRKRRERRLRGHTETIGERFERDRAALLPLPATPYEACEKISARVSSLSLVRYRTNDYSVPTEYGHRQVWVKGYVHEVVIACGSEVIARHQRSYEREAVGLRSAALPGAA
jgi:hypothetical protein